MILITGTAGFIGFHLAKRCLERGFRVAGIDNVNDYYSVDLKRARLAELSKHEKFTFKEIDISNSVDLRAAFETVDPRIVVNLAAQAGVRYGLENPHAYSSSNLVGFLNILEACRHGEVRHLIYASSSSVYGMNAKYPFSVHDGTDHPLSLYAATKRSNELMAHSYSHLFRIPTTGLRFFTVYGPWGRPDMALFKFTESIIKGDPIDVYGAGQQQRDFTYVDDIVSGIEKMLMAPPLNTPDPKWNPWKPDPSTSSAPYRIYNIGNNNPVELMHFIQVLEDSIGKKAVIRNLPMQPGDVTRTEADISCIASDFGYQPTTKIEEGIPRFVEWYRGFYGV